MCLRLVLVTDCFQPLPATIAEKQDVEAKGYEAIAFFDFFADNRRIGLNHMIAGRGVHPFVMALSYGRPGVHLVFSLDGAGRRWTDPIPIRKGDPKRWFAKSCGYTAIAPLDANRFLLAYSDFEHKGKDGKRRKTILVRRVTLHTGATAR